jgi:hypothetical protein
MVSYPKGAVHPKVVGDRTTAVVLARLLEVFEIVLLPFGENQRYDLVVDDQGRMLRIQCKTGRLLNGVIKFAACSTIYHHPNRASGQPYRHHYRGEADLFGVYCPETDGVYLVPVDEVGIRQGSLRIEPTANNQASNVRWASQYEIPRAQFKRRSRHGAVATAVQAFEDRGESTLFERPARYAV